MAMTFDQWAAKREAIILQMASVRSLSSGDKSISNRDVAELQKALGVVEAEMARIDPSSAASMGIQVGRTVRLQSRTGF